MKVVLADIEIPALEGAVAAMRDQSLDVTGVPTDLTQWDSVKATADEAVRVYGKINVAFLNAGVASGGRGNMWDVDLNDWAWGMAVNVWGVIHGIKAFLPIMTAQDEEGHCVITSSSVGVIAPTPSGGVYAMTKAAGLSLAEVLYGSFAHKVRRSRRRSWFRRAPSTRACSPRTAIAKRSTLRSSRARKHRRSPTRRCSSA
jgi:NAD(P)-dependent dehydrogenase (short-subunit alcohol dehydrogenase family)